MKKLERKIGVDLSKRLLLLAVLVLFMAAGTASAVEMVKGPYLIYPDVITEMTVLWQLDGTVASPGCKLEWGTTTSYGTSTTVTGSTSGDNLHRYKHTIDSLDEATKYFYKVWEGNGTGTSHTGTFYTAPLATETSLRFLAYGDTRSSSTNHNAVCQQIVNTYEGQEEFQTFLLHVGDWVGNGGTSDHWNDFFGHRSNKQGIRDMLANIPVMGCIGNHEIKDDADASNYGDFWPYEDADTRFYYSFDYGPVHVAVVDVEIDDFANPSTQFTWLKADMITPEAQNAAWRFVMFHRPAYCSTKVHGNSVNTQELISNLEAYLAVMSKKGVDIVFAGHVHNYSRATVDGITHITTGGGGAPLYEIDPFDPFIVTTTETYQFCEITIDGDVLDFVARDKDGVVIDAFTLIDVVAPTIESVTACDTTVTVTFSEGVDPTTAEDEDNYSITNPTVLISSVSFDNYKTATLTTSTALIADVTYTLGVNGVKDFSGIDIVDEKTVTPTNCATSAIIVDFGATWKYLYDGSNQGTAWQAYSFNDSSWGSGAAQLGLSGDNPNGEGDEETVIGLQVDGYITTYFRHKFNVTNIALINKLTIDILHDDGAVIYINDVEVDRTYMPTGTISYNTHSSIQGENSTTFFDDISPSYLEEGDNIITVEVHQRTDTSSDVSFALELNSVLRSDVDDIDGEYVWDNDEDLWQFYVMDEFEQGQWVAKKYITALLNLIPSHCKTDAGTSIPHYHFQYDFTSSQRDEADNYWDWYYEVDTRETLSRVSDATNDQDSLAYAMHEYVSQDAKYNRWIVHCEESDQIFTDDCILRNSGTDANVDDRLAYEIDSVYEHTTIVGDLLWNGQCPKEVSWKCDYSGVYEEAKAAPIESFAHCFDTPGQANLDQKTADTPTGDWNEDYWDRSDVHVYEPK